MYSDQKPLSSVILKSQYERVFQSQAGAIPQKVQPQVSNSQRKAEIKKCIEHWINIKKLTHPPN
jgi:hypothetical protein